MQRVIDTIRDFLPPTPTYKRREFIWIPGNTGSDDRDGTLVIRLSKGLRRGSKVEEDTYGVQEEPTLGRPGRTFLVLNDTDPDQPDVYKCFLSADGLGDTCTCRAGLCRVPEGCKHAHALAAIGERGGFDPEEEDG